MLDVFCIATGAMISSGLFILPGIAYAKCGSAVILAYFLSGLLVLPGVLSKAELATAMPRAGGTYFYMERSLGPVAGVIGGLANWLSLSLKSAFALMGLGIFAVVIYPDITLLQVKMIAVGCCLFFMVLNMWSVKETGRAQIIMVFVALGILAFYAIWNVPHVRLPKYIPFMPHGFKSVFSVAGLVFISYGGLTKVASIAEEVKKPKRNIPLGMLSAFFVTLSVYVVTIFITVGVADSTALAETRMPLSLVAGQTMGQWGAILLAIAAVMAFITTANAGILSASRFPLAMSRDRLLPRVFRYVNRRKRTPYIAIFVTGGFMIVVILFLGLEDLIKTASTMKILLFIFCNISVIIMRESKIQNYRPTFRSPFYPWLQIFGIIVPAFLIFEMGKIALVITGLFVGAALVWYRLYVYKKIDRQSALVHLIERITAKELVRKTLPGELREILRERDNIIEDRFDRLIKSCEILDIQEKMDVEKLFSKLALTLSPRMEMKESDLVKLFWERERESSTVLAPGLAIPHIVIPGKKKFDVLLVRAKAGIRFPGHTKPVRTLFVLMGSKDERNFHLRVLAAIAQIVQDEDFEKHWMSAYWAEDLRDIVLLAERKRFKDG